MKTISFILHGKHLHKHSIQKEAQDVFENEFNLIFHTTQSSRQAEELARESVNDGTNYLIAVGGDGTMHEVINGIMTCSKEKRENLIVGLLPVGSGNDFARSMKLSKQVADLYSMIKNDKHNKIDVGMIECRNMKDEKKTVYFSNIADVGLGAEVAKKVNEGNKTYGPNLAFFSATLTTFLEYKKKKVRITSEGFNYEGNILILCLANAKYFGSGLGIAPHADFNDGKIAITLAGDVTLTDYLKNIFKIRKCQIVNHPQIQYGKVDSILVEPIGQPCLIEADGEMIGKIPLKAQMLKEEINFLTDVLE